LREVRQLEVTHCLFEQIDRAIPDGQGRGRIKNLLAPRSTRGLPDETIVSAQAVDAIAGEIIQQFCGVARPCRPMRLNGPERPQTLSAVKENWISSPVL
jgi:hypothetical protein